MGTSGQAGASSLRRYAYAAKQVVLNPRRPDLFSFYCRGGLGSLYFALDKPWFHGLKIGAVFDIGAHAGGFAVTSRQLLPEAQIYAFEPLPASYQLLCAKMVGDRLFQAYNVALGTQPGKTIFHEDAFSASSSFLPMAETHKREFSFTGRTTDVEVEVATLDSVAAHLNLEVPYMVKIDVQGFEDKVLLGGELTIRHASMLIIETSFQVLYEGQALFGDVWTLLRDWGYTYRGALEQMYAPSDSRILQQDAIFMR